MSLFLAVCYLSLGFFGVCLLQFSRHRRKAWRRSPKRVCRPVLPEPAAAELFSEIEEQMARFLVSHKRDAAAVLLAVSLLGLLGVARPQSASGSHAWKGDGSSLVWQER